MSEAYVTIKIDSLADRKERMVNYMQLKITEEDWHGVADAAMDIRDIESELLVYKDWYGKINKD